MIKTRATEVLGIAHPVVLAPVGNTGDAELVASVSEAGGLGILACTWRGIDETRAAITEIRARTSRPFGINFVLHLTDPAAFDAVLEQRVPVLSFFRGDPAEAIAKAHAAGALAVHQATTVDEARRAAAAGADAIIAQGVEAGGHMGPTPLWAILTNIVAAVQDRPVLACGGLVDGRDLAAALCLGAGGVVMGTRFLASAESKASEAHKRAILAAALGDTIDSGVWDLLWGPEWPGVKVRSLRNRLTDRWAGRETELAEVIGAVRADLDEGYAQSDFTRAPMLAGESASRIHDLPAASDIVRQVVAEAEAVLGRASALAG